MALRQNTTEGGTNGVVPTTANSGGGSGDAFTNVIVFGSGAATYSTTQKMHGSLSYHLTTTAASGDTAYLDYSGANDMPVAMRFYIYLTTGQTTGVRIAAFMSSTSTLTAGINITGTNKLQLVAADGSTITAMTGALATGTWYRVEFATTVATATTGTATLSYYVGDSTSPIQTITGSAYNFGTAAVTLARLGKSTSTAGATDVYIDDYAFQNGSASFIGPSATAMTTGTVSLRSQGAIATGSTFTLTLAAPSGVQSGDYMVAFIHGQTSASPTDISCAGWSRVGPSFVANDTGTRLSGFFAKIATGSEPSTYAFTMGSGSTGRCVGFIAAYTGVNTTSPVASYTDWTKVSTGTTSLSIPTDTGAASLFTLEINTGNFSSPNSYAVTSYTGGLTLLNNAYNPTGTENTSVSRSALNVWTGIASSSGVPAHVITTSGSAAQTCAALVSLNATQVPVSNGLAIKVSTGSSLVTANFKLADGAGGFVTPVAYKAVRPGYTSVTQMLAQTTFYAAHRGGSFDYPEMSLYAYGQSALLGYPALEFSLARTSDGVWFGLHDASLDRTSLGTGGGSGTSLVASSLTWAQVQTYTILGSNASNNTSQASRPYMRWEELMLVYYTSHVIFVDPKNAYNYRAELLNMMDSMPGKPTDRFIAKYSGVSGTVDNSSGWAHDATVHGYKSWGYFYDTDLSNYGTYAPRWDILGMNYTAAQSYWDSLRSAAPGKPVIGHICPDAASVATALSKGANGIMASGVKANIPPAFS